MTRYWKNPLTSMAKFTMSRKGKDKNIGLEWKDATWYEVPQKAARDTSEETRDNIRFSERLSRNREMLIGNTNRSEID